MRIYPVIHVREPSQSVEQAEIAFECNSDGVYLIHHPLGESDPNTLLDSYNAVRERFPSKHVGVNYLVNPLEGYALTQRALDTEQMVSAPTSLWFDNAMGNKYSIIPALSYLSLLEKFREEDPRLGNIKFLGGVAFKYTLGYTSDPEESAKIANALTKRIDIITTSGKGTGSPPSPEKIAAMKKAISPRLLAVASGIDITNLADYRWDIDMALVSSSIETEPYSGIFIPKKVEELVTIAKDLYLKQRRGY